MTQNIYDNPEFFAGYSQLLRSRDGLDGMPEWPALRALLPDMKGRRVLDLGCGFGWFCRWAREAGAGSGAGIAVSEKMLERARADTTGSALTYQRARLEAFTIAARTFDPVYSAPTFHYLGNLSALVERIP